jgi:ABC-2 type transport system ATP-binding protein
VATTIIRVSDVAKKFTINKDKSLKERLTGLGRNRKYVQEFWALQDVSFELEASKTLGLIGANGSGKSTLLKVIGGILSPDVGYVERRGRLAALLELGAGFHGDLTGRENVYLNASILGLTNKQTDTYFDAIVDFSGIEKFIDTQVKFYSSGMSGWRSRWRCTWTPTCCSSTRCSPSATSPSSASAWSASSSSSATAARSSSSPTASTRCGSSATA